MHTTHLFHLSQRINYVTIQLNDTVSNFIPPCITRNVSMYKFDHLWALAFFDQWSHLHIVYLSNPTTNKLLINYLFVPVIVCINWWYLPVFVQVKQEECLVKLEIVSSLHLGYCTRPSSTPCMHVLMFSLIHFGSANASFTSPFIPFLAPFTGLVIMLLNPSTTFSSRFLGISISFHHKTWTSCLIYQPC